MYPQIFKLSALTVLLSASGYSFADETAEPDSTVALPTVTVTGQNRSTRTENRDSYTTSAMRTAAGLALSPKETPQSVSVVTRTRMDDQNLNTLDEALMQTTGINVLKASDQVFFQSRGFNLENIQEDGINRSWTTQITGTAEASQGLINMAVYDHLEVVRGATGLMQNSGEPGGTVNLVRKKPTAAFQGYVRGTAGRWDKYTLETDVSGSLTPDKSLRGRFVGQLGKQGSFTDHIQGDNQLLYGVLSYNLGDNTTLTAGAEWNKSDTVPNWYGVPLAADGSDLRLPRNTFLSPAWSRAKYNKFNLFTEGSHHFNDNWKITFGLNWIRSKGGIKSSGLFGDNNGSGTNVMLNGIGSNGLSTMQLYQNRHNTARQFSTNINVNGKYRLFGHTHDVMMGGDFSHEHLNNTRLGKRTAFPGNAYPIYAFNPEQVSEPDWTVGELQNRYDYKIRQYGLYAGTRINFADRVKLILGSRYSRYVLQDAYFNTLTGRQTYAGELRENGKLTPYAGAVWDITPNVTAYASYTDIFKPSNSKDYNGATLDPVQGNSFEAGIKTSWLNGKLNTSAALYRIIQKNRSVSVSLPQGETTPDGRTAYDAAAGRVRSQGFEFEADGAITPNWHIFAGYTFNRNKYLNQENTSLRTAGAVYSPHTPKHTFRLYTNYRLPGRLNKWRVGTGVSAQSSSSIVRTQYSVKRGGYAVWNADLSYRPTKNLLFSAAVGNLTDKRYYTHYNTFHRGGNNFYGEPRNITLKLDYKFQ